MPSPAAAQAPGVRGGVSVDPDQFYVGGHYETGPLVDRLHFKPNIELGFGDDITLFAINFEFVYKIHDAARLDALRRRRTGRQLLLVRRQSTTAIPSRASTRCSARRPRGGLFFEVKFGAIDSPDLKFGVGWSFK